MSSNTTYPLIKPSLVCQSLTKGVGFSVFETSSMNPNTVSVVNRELISGTTNGHVRNGGLVSHCPESKNKFKIKNA